jgi:hypothetical protein
MPGSGARPILRRDRAARLVAVLAAAVAARAEAAAPSSLDAERAAIVFISPPDPLLEPVLRERLDGRRIALQVHHRQTAELDRLLTDAADRRWLVHVWIDLARAGEARLVFSHPARQRFAVRSVQTPVGLGELGRETIGTVVESAVDSLLAGATFELTRPEASRSLETWTQAPLPQTEPPKGDGRALAVGVGWGGQLLGPPRAVMSLGPALSLRLERRRWLASLDGMYLLPAEIPPRPLGASFSALSMRLGAGITSRCRQLCLSAAARGGVDVLWLRPTARTGAAVAGPQRTVWSPMAGIQGSLVWRRGALAASLTPSLDMDLLGTTLVANDGAGQRTVAAFWRLRPGFLAAVGFGL